MLPCFSVGDVAQFLLLGPDGVGKSTLLYKLKMGSHWKKQEIIRDMTAIKEKPSENVGFHYEEMGKVTFRYGIWDVPGGQAARPLWPIFYRFLHINAILLMVNVAQLYDQTIASIEETDSMRQWIQYLVHEDELRDAAICILLNDKNDENANTNMLTERECEEVLGVHQLQLVSKERVKTFMLNSADVSEGSGTWAKIVEFVRKQIAAVSK